MARTPVWVLLLTLAPALLGPMTAGDQALPDDVVAWFDEEAAAEAATAFDGDAPATVGEPRPLHLWSEDFLDGEPTDTPVVATEEWVAPYAVDGTPAGTVVAWREDGVVTFASADDHAELAAALTEEAPAGALIVEEPMLAAHFALDDGTVTTLLTGFYVGPPTAPLDTVQAALAEQVEDLVAAAVPEPGGDGRWLPLLWGVLGVAFVAAVALAVLSGRRRTAPGNA